MNINKILTNYVACALLLCTGSALTMNNPKCAPKQFVTFLLIPEKLLIPGNSIARIEQHFRKYNIYAELDANHEEISLAGAPMHVMKQAYKDAQELGIL